MQKHLFAPLSAVFVLFAGCASYTDQTAKMRSNYSNNAFQEALLELEKSDIKEQNRNRLLYQLEKGMIYDRLTDKEKARTALLQADRYVDELFTTSVSKTAASFIVNDAASDYEGEDYEKVAIHTMLAHSFIAEGNLKSARVEAKKINDRLLNITKDYDPKYASYSEDAYARYLSGLIFEALGEKDDAIIDYKKALEVYKRPLYRNFYIGTLPAGLIKAYYKVAKERDRKNLLSELEKDYPELTKAAAAESQKDGGYVVVVHEAGLVARKVNKDFFLPIDRQIVRFSFPYIDEQSRSRLYFGATGVEVGGQFHVADNCADMSSIAYQNLEDRRGRLIAKGLARLLLKGQLTRKAEQLGGPLAGLAMNIVGAVTETADTRSWTLLPRGFYVTRLYLPKGKQRLSVRTNGRTTQFIDVDIEAGQYVLLRDAAT